MLTRLSIPRYRPTLHSALPLVAGRARVHVGGRRFLAFPDLSPTTPKQGGFPLTFNAEFSQPLKPNFSRRLLIDLQKAPSEWAGEVDVRVVGLEFDR
jgi:hypothetical protein